MSRNYEAVYIFDSTLEDAAINDKISRFHGLLSPSEQPEVNHWGPPPARLRDRHKGERLLRRLPLCCRADSAPRVRARAALSMMD
jgi:hypothetical protein